MPFTSKAKRIEVGVDWLSATVPMDRTDIAEIKEKAYAMLRMMSDAGNLIRPMSSLGYVGVSVSGSFIGERQDGLFIRFTGPWADRAFWNVYHPSMHVSRIDLHVTIWHGPKGKHTGQTVKRQAEDHNINLRKNYRRKIKLIQNNLGGYSVYIGSEKGENFARCYDKGAEDEDKKYAGAWRFEVQWHNDSATKVAEGLYHKQEDRGRVISATVADYYNKRGVLTAWANDNTYAITYNNSQPVSDVQTSLEWLRTQVSPTIRRLSHLGYRSNVIEALGLLLPHHYAIEELPRNE